MKNIFESVYAELDRIGELYECDGAGGCAGGCEGGCGDAAGGAITSDSVLGPSGEMEKGHGCMGPGDFHVPFPVMPCLFRWGSTPKKSKKKKTAKKIVKNPYANNVKVIVAEDDTNVIKYTGQAKVEFDKVVAGHDSTYTGVLNYNDTWRLAWMIREDGVLHMYKPYDTGNYWTVYATSLLEDGRIMLDYKAGKYKTEQDALNAIYRAAEKHRKALEEHLAEIA